MLELVIKTSEFFDEVNNIFIYPKDTVLTLEHSLVSLAKWESKWKKPFLGKEQKTFQETVDYIVCMTISRNIDKNIYNCITDTHINLVNNYVNDPMTATTFSNKNKSSRREIVTAEIIYYQMITLNIPLTCEKWHLSRLLTLIEVCNVKNSPSKKMNRNEILANQKAINDARRKQSNSKG